MLLRPSLFSKPLDHDVQRMFLPHYLIVWECQGSASRPVDNRGDMAGWSRTRVQGALALDTQRAWACPRSHTAPGGWRDVTSTHPATKIVFSHQYVMSRAWPAPPSTKGPNAQRATGDLSPRPLLGQQVCCDKMEVYGGGKWLEKMHSEINQWLQEKFTWTIKVTIFHFYKLWLWLSTCISLTPRCFK